MIGKYVILLNYRQSVSRGKYWQSNMAFTIQMMSCARSVTTEPERVAEFFAVKASMVPETIVSISTVAVIVIITYLSVVLIRR